LTLLGDRFNVSNEAVTQGTPLEIISFESRRLGQRPIVMKLQVTCRY